MPDQAPWDREYTAPVIDPKSAIVLPNTNKGIFTDSAGRVSGFAGRMVWSGQNMNNLEDSGFDPVNMTDVAKDNLPFIPEWMERFFQSDKYKLYNANKINWATAQLRRETGAVINASEIVWIDETYFPMLGEGSAVQQLKRTAREEATKAMITEAGGAYKGLTTEESQLKALKIEKQRARNILLQRAKNNPALQKRINKILGTM